MSEAERACDVVGAAADRMAAAPGAAPANDPARVRAGMLLYAVTDSAWLAGHTLESCVADALAGGATFVQLREKDASTDELVRAGWLLKRLCAEAGVPFVVDDDVEAARLLDADGVHVGQEDESCAAARAALGSGKIVGVSVRTLDEARAAEASGADYLGVGAVFGTATKPEAAEVSLDDLRAICEAVSIPVVAIGGLNEQTIGVLAGSGAAGAAVVSAIFAADDVRSSTARLRLVCDEVFA